MDQLSAQYVQMAGGHHSQLHNAATTVGFVQQLNAVIERSSAPRKNFLIDTTTPHGDAVITEASAMKPGIGWITLQVTEGIKKGVHEWCVKIENQGETTDGSGLMLGILPKSFAKYDSFISQGGGWCLSRAGKFYGHWRRHEASPSTTISFGTGDRVVFTLDYDNARMTVRVGEKQIVGEVSNLTSEVYPAISLHYRHQHVRFEYHVTHDRSARQRNWVERGVLPTAAALLPLSPAELEALPLDSYLFSSAYGDRRPPVMRRRRTRVQGPATSVSGTGAAGKKSSLSRLASFGEVGSAGGGTNTGEDGVSLFGEESAAAAAEEVDGEGFDSQSESDEGDDGRSTDSADDPLALPSGNGPLSVSDASLTLTRLQQRQGILSGGGGGGSAVAAAAGAVPYASLDAFTARLTVLLNAFAAVRRYTEVSPATRGKFLSPTVTAEYLRKRFYESLHGSLRGGSNGGGASHNSGLASGGGGGCGTLYDATLNCGAVIVIHMFAKVAGTGENPMALPLVRSLTDYLLSLPLFSLAETNPSGGVGAFGGSNLSPEVVQLAVNNIFALVESSLDNTTTTTTTTNITKTTAAPTSSCTANNNSSTASSAGALPPLTGALIELATLLALQRGVVHETLRASRALLRCPQGVVSAPFIDWLQRNASALRPRKELPDIGKGLKMACEDLDHFYPTAVTPAAMRTQVLSVAFGGDSEGLCSIFVHSVEGLSRWVEQLGRYEETQHTRKPDNCCTGATTSSMAATLTHLFLLTNKMASEGVAIVIYTTALELHRVFQLTEMDPTWPREQRANPQIASGPEDQVLLLYESHDQPAVYVANGAAVASATSSAVLSAGGSIARAATRGKPAGVHVQGFLLPSFPRSSWTTTLKAPSPSVDFSLSHCLALRKPCLVDLGPPDGYLQLPAGHVTVEIWVTLLDKEDAATLYQHGDKGTTGEVFMETARLEGAYCIRGGYRHDARGSCVVSAPLPPTAETHFFHIALVFDGRWHLLFDGEEVACNRRGPHVSLEAPKQRWTLCNNCTCTLAGLRVWLLGKSAREVARDYKRFLAGDEPGLACQMFFNEFSGNVVFNYIASTRSRHAVCSGSFRHAPCDNHPWRSFSGSTGFAASTTVNPNGNGNANKNSATEVSTASAQAELAPPRSGIHDWADLSLSRAFCYQGQLILATQVTDAAPYALPSGRVFVFFDLRSGSASSAFFYLTSKSPAQGFMGLDTAWSRVYELFELDADFVKDAGGLGGDGASANNSSNSNADTKVICLAQVPLERDASAAMTAFGSALGGSGDSAPASSTASPLRPSAVGSFERPHHHHHHHSHPPAGASGGGGHGLPPLRPGESSMPPPTPSAFLLMTPTASVTLPFSASAAAGGGGNGGAGAAAAGVHRGKLTYNALSVWLLRLLSQYAAEEPAQETANLFSPLADDVGRRCSAEVQVTLHEHFRVVKGPCARRVVALASPVSKDVIACALQILLRLIRRVRAFGLHPASVGLNVFEDSPSSTEDINRLLRELFVFSSRRRSSSNSPLNASATITLNGSGSSTSVATTVAGAGGACGSGEKEGGGEADGSTLVGLLGDVVNEAGKTLPLTLGVLARTVIIEGIDLFIPRVRSRAKLLREVLANAGAAANATATVSSSLDSGARTDSPRPPLTPLPLLLHTDRVPALDALVDGTVESLTTVLAAAPLLYPEDDTSNVAGRRGPQHGSTVANVLRISNENDDDDDDEKEGDQSSAGGIEKDTITDNDWDADSSDSSSDTEVGNVKSNNNLHATVTPQRVGGSCAPPSQRCNDKRHCRLRRCGTSSVADSLRETRGTLAVLIAESLTQLRVHFASASTTTDDSGIIAASAASTSSLRQSQQPLPRPRPSSYTGTIPPPQAGGSGSKSRSPTPGDARLAPATATGGSGTTGSSTPAPPPPPARIRGVHATSLADAISALQLLLLSACQGLPAEQIMNAAATSQNVRNVFAMPRPNPSSRRCVRAYYSTLFSAAIEGLEVLQQHAKSLTAEDHAVLASSFLSVPLHTAVLSIPLVVSIKDAPWFLQALDRLLPLCDATRELLSGSPSSLPPSHHQRTRTEASAPAAATATHLSTTLESASSPSLSPPTTFPTVSAGVTLKHSPLHVLFDAVLLSASWVATCMSRAATPVVAAVEPKASPATGATAETEKTPAEQQARERAGAAEAFANNALLSGGVDVSVLKEVVAALSAESSGKRNGIQQQQLRTKSSTTVRSNQRRERILVLVREKKTEWIAAQKRLDVLGTKLTDDIASLLVLVAATTLYLSNELCVSFEELAPQVLRRLLPLRNHLLERRTGMDTAAFVGLLDSLRMRCCLLLCTLSPLENRAMEVDLMASCSGHRLDVSVKLLPKGMTPIPPARKRWLWALSRVRATLHARTANTLGNPKLNLTYAIAFVSQAMQSTVLTASTMKRVLCGRERLARTRLRGLEQLLLLMRKEPSCTENVAQLLSTKDTGVTGGAGIKSSLTGGGAASGAANTAGGSAGAAGASAAGGGGGASGAASSSMQQGSGGNEGGGGLCGKKACHFEANLNGCTQATREQLRGAMHAIVEWLVVYQRRRTPGSGKPNALASPSMSEAASRLPFLCAFLRRTWWPRDLSLLRRLRLVEELFTSNCSVFKEGRGPHSTPRLLTTKEQQHRRGAVAHQQRIAKLMGGAGTTTAGAAAASGRTSSSSGARAQAAAAGDDVVEVPLVPTTREYAKRAAFDCLKQLGLQCAAALSQGGETASAGEAEGESRLPLCEPRLAASQFLRTLVTTVHAELQECLHCATSLPNEPSEAAVSNSRHADGNDDARERNTFTAQLLASMHEVLRDQVQVLCSLLATVFKAIDSSVNFRADLALVVAGCARTIYSTLASDTLLPPTERMMPSQLVNYCTSSDSKADGASGSGNSNSNNNGSGTTATPISRGAAYLHLVGMMLSHCHPATANGVFGTVEMRVMCERYCAWDAVTKDGATVATLLAMAVDSLQASGLNSISRAALLSLRELLCSRPRWAAELEALTGQFQSDLRYAAMATPERPIYAFKMYAWATLLGGCAFFLPTPGMRVRYYAEEKDGSNTNGGVSCKAQDAYLASVPVAAPIPLAPLDTPPDAVKRPGELVTLLPTHTTVTEVMTTDEMGEPAFTETATERASSAGALMAGYPPHSCNDINSATFLTGKEVVASQDSIFLPPLPDAAGYRLPQYARLLEDFVVPAVQYFYGELSDSDVRTLNNVEVAALISFTHLVFTAVQARPAACETLLESRTLLAIGRFANCAKAHHPLPLLFLKEYVAVALSGACDALAMAAASLAPTSTSATPSGPDISPPSSAAHDGGGGDGSSSRRSNSPALSTLTAPPTTRTTTAAVQQRPTPPAALSVGGRDAPSTPPPSGPFQSLGNSPVMDGINATTAHTSPGTSPASGPSDRSGGPLSMALLARRAGSGRSPTPGHAVNSPTTAVTPLTAMLSAAMAGSLSPTALRDGTGRMLPSLFSGTRTNIGDVAGNNTATVAAAPMLLRGNSGFLSRATTAAATASFTSGTGGTGGTGGTSTFAAKASLKPLTTALCFYAVPASDKDSDTASGSGSARGQLPASVTIMPSRRSVRPDKRESLLDGDKQPPLGGKSAVTFPAWSDGITLEASVLLCDRVFPQLGEDYVIPSANPIGGVLGSRPAIRFSLFSLYMKPEKSASLGDLKTHSKLTCLLHVHIDHDFLVCTLSPQQAHANPLSPPKNFDCRLPVKPEDWDHFLYIAVILDDNAIILAKGGESVSLTLPPMVAATVASVLGGSTSCVDRLVIGSHAASSASSSGSSSAVSAASKTLKGGKRESAGQATSTSANAHALPPPVPLDDCSIVLVTGVRMWGSSQLKSTLKTVADLVARDVELPSFDPSEYSCFFAFQEGAGGRAFSVDSSFSAELDGYVSWAGCQFHTAPNFIDPPDKIAIGAAQLSPGGSSQTPAAVIPRAEVHTYFASLDAKSMDRVGNELLWTLAARLSRMVVAAAMERCLSPDYALYKQSQADDAKKQANRANTASGKGKRSGKESVVCRGVTMPGLPFDPFLLFSAGGYMLARQVGNVFRYSDVGLLSARTVAIIRDFIQYTMKYIGARQQLLFQNNSSSSKEGHNDSNRFEQDDILVGGGDLLASFTNETGYATLELLSEESEYFAVEVGSSAGPAAGGSAVQTSWCSSAPASTSPVLPLAFMNGGRGMLYFDARSRAYDSVSVFKDRQLKSLQEKFPDSNGQCQPCNLHSSSLQWAYVKVSLRHSALLPPSNAAAAAAGSTMAVFGASVKSLRPAVARVIFGALTDGFSEGVIPHRTLSAAAQEEAVGTLLDANFLSGLILLSDSQAAFDVRTHAVSIAAMLLDLWRAHPHVRPFDRCPLNIMLAHVNAILVVILQRDKLGHENCGELSPTLGTYNCFTQALFELLVSAIRLEEVWLQSPHPLRLRARWERLFQHWKGCTCYVPVTPPALSMTAAPIGPGHTGGGARRMSLTSGSTLFEGDAKQQQQQQQQLQGVTRRPSANTATIPIDSGRPPLLSLVSVDPLNSNQRLSHLPQHPQQMWHNRGRSFGSLSTTLCGTMPPFEMHTMWPARLHAAGASSNNTHNGSSGNVSGNSANMGSVNVKGNGEWLLRCDRGRVTARSTIGYTRGRFYFEVRIAERPLNNPTCDALIIGLVTAQSRIDETGEPLGQDGESWGFDGSRLCRVHQGFRTDFTARAKWKAGDLLGVLVDIDHGRLCLTHYERQASAFDKLRTAGGVLGAAGTAAAASTGKGLPVYFPAITLSAGCTCDVNFGASPFGSAMPLPFLPANPQHFCGLQATRLWSLLVAVEWAQQCRAATGINYGRGLEQVTATGTVSQGQLPASAVPSPTSGATAVSPVALHAHGAFGTLQRQIREHCDGRCGPLSTVDFLTSSTRLRECVDELQTDEVPCVVRGAVAVRRGKWYYEVLLRMATPSAGSAEGTLTAGWTVVDVDGDWSAGAVPTGSGGLTVLPGKALGDDEYSWVLEGRRMIAKHNKHQISLGRHVWRDGDVVGCMLDCDAGTMRFTVNGQLQREVHDTDGDGVLFRHVDTLGGAGLSPAIAVDAKMCVVFLWNQDDLRYPPVDLLARDEELGNPHGPRSRSRGNATLGRAIYRAIGATNVYHDAMVEYFLGISADNEDWGTDGQQQYLPSHAQSQSQSHPARGVASPTAATVSLQVLERVLRYISKTTDMSPFRVPAYCLYSLMGLKSTLPIASPRKAAAAAATATAATGGRPPLRAKKTTNCRASTSSTAIPVGDGIGNSAGMCMRSCSEVGDSGHYCADRDNEAAVAWAATSAVLGLTPSQLRSALEQLYALSAAAESLHRFGQDGRLPFDYEEVHYSLRPSPLHGALLSLRRFCLPYLALRNLRRFLFATDGPGEALKLTVNRRRALAAMRDGTTLPSTQCLHESLFGQVYSLLASKSATLFCTSKKMWSVTFFGEGADDVGGPYRESLSQMCAELMSGDGLLPLFLPSPNQTADVGESRDVMVLSPRPGPSDVLDMFRFVGRLLGGCLRGAEPLSLYLPSAVWKLFVGDLPDAGDLARVDQATLTALRYMEKLVTDRQAKRSSFGKEKEEDEDEKEEDEVSALCPDGFTLQDDANVPHELVHNGRGTPVTMRNARVYISLALRLKLLLSTEARLKALAEGFHQVVPICGVSSLKWYELEELVCGQRDYDPDALLDSARYEAIDPDDTRVLYLRLALKDFTQHQRAMFMRFVSGRERLPPDMRLKIMPDKSASTSNHSTPPLQPPLMIITGAGGGGGGGRGSTFTPPPLPSGGRGGSFVRHQQQQQRQQSSSVGNRAGARGVAQSLQLAPQALAARGTPAPAHTPYDDTRLPHASTCFYWLSLPNYSSLTVMKERLLFAIEQCMDIDADFRVHDGDATQEEDEPQLTRINMEEGDDRFEDFSHLR